MTVTQEQRYRKEDLPRLAAQAAINCLKQAQRYLLEAGQTKYRDQREDIGAILLDVEAKASKGAAA